MLEIIRCRHIDDKQDVFLNFQPSDAAWVVSDLQSKWHLQKELLDRHRILQQSSIWRATELWRHFAFQLRPDLKFLSPELAQILFWDWIEPLGLPWAKSPKVVPLLLNQMQMWMGVFADPSHREIMAEWFQSNQDAYVRWGHWFELCSEIWRRCQDQNLVMISWLPALLLSEDLDQLKWERKLVFDLGPQMSLVEGLLLKALASRLDIKVLFPEGAWVSLMKNTLRPYESLLDEPYRGDTGWKPSVDNTLSFGRFSTQLAEVKDSVARVRQWLDGGIDPQKIALVAPDIEEYWPAIQLYCEQEGIPVCKPLMARLGGFIEIAQWMSSLRTALSKISSSDLEVYLFSLDENPRLGFDEFRVLFTNVYDSYDLGRAQDLFESEQEIIADQPLPLADFLVWALTFWRAGNQVNALLALLQAAGQEVPAYLQLKPAQWLSYLEGIAARRELSLRPSHESGIWCVSISSADWLPATHGILLNISEMALRSFEISPVSASEAQKVFTDTGYAVSSSDHQEREFELLWFLNREWSELRLCFSQTDFGGRVLTPSKMWMWAAFTNESLKREAETPQTTRWDEIQRQPLANLAKVRDWPESREADLEFALHRDLSNEYSSWGNSTGERLSASSLEKYWKCPFVFAAERKLKLIDSPALDLDMDRRTRGSLLHALAERLGEEPIRYEWKEDELLQLIEATREKEKIRLGDERLWPAIRSQHLQLARGFLQFEKAWRQRFPMTTTVGRELAFECYWDAELNQPSSKQGSLVLSGRIDRVDRDSSGRYALVDYKASSSGLRNWKSWLEKYEMQLAFYSLLIESGLTSLTPGSVVAANYYVIKESDRRKGFHVRDESSELYCSSERHFNFINPLEKTELFDRLKQQVGEAIASILAGRFEPKPSDESSCTGCSWSQLCRAPHLN